MENHKTVVKYSVKFVRNLGNYETMHIEVGIEDQTREGETVPVAYDRIKNFVEKKVMQEVVDMEKQLRAAENQGGY